LIFSFFITNKIFVKVIINNKVSAVMSYLRNDLTIFIIK
jgi:hypothetical protein